MRHTTYILTRFSIENDQPDKGMVKNRKNGLNNQPIVSDVGSGVGHYSINNK